MSNSLDSVRPDVSFVVIAHNEEAVIRDCISSIAAQDGGATFEIVVVDDGSTDRTASLVMEIAANWPQITLVRHPKIMGRGAARATGIAAVRADLVAMVDADILLPKHWLQRCRVEITEQGADAVGGIAVPDGDVTYIQNRFALTPKAAPLTVLVSGSNGLYRRRVFEMVAVDPSLAEGEDVALNHAMAAVGLQCRTIRDLLVEHRESKGFLESLHWLYQSGKGATRQLARYRKVRAPDIALAGLVATITASLIASRRGVDRRVAWALPCAYLIAVTGTHMVRKFEFRGSAARFVLATATYAIFIGGYFAGRIVGIPNSMRKRTDPREA
jgi:GT2 family glycosyltransferase